MPIEFRCSQCGRLLRTGDDTAGQQAQCPECDAIGTVPTPPENDNPFAAGPSPIDAGQCFISLANRVSAPATALTVTAILGMAANAIGLVYNLIVVGMGGAMGPPRQHDIPFMINHGAGAVGNAFAIVIGILILVGATKMKNLDNYALAMTAAIVAMIPCFSPCCLLGLPFGIWALVVLSDSSVKAAFKS